MRIERWLQYNIALMAMLGTLLFGMGHPERSLKLPLLAAFVAITSVIFTDGLKWFQLNRLVANLFALIVAAYTLTRFHLAELAGDKLLEIANLLAYLQFILFYEAKGQRTYSHLMVLSLLQVVVAAALHLNLVAGLILVVYLLVATSTLMYFFLYREQIRVEHGDRDPSAPHARSNASSAGSSNKNGQRRNVQLIEFSTNVEPAVARGTKWNGLARHIGSMAAVSFGLTVILFYSLPRNDENQWQGAPGAVKSEVGFSDTITLAESDLIAQPNRAVMRVSFFDHETNEPYPVGGEPYFRGAVLTVYENGVWRHPAHQQMQATGNPLSQNVRPGMVRQEILLEPSNDVKLFAVFPVYSIRDDRKGVSPPQPNFGQGEVARVSYDGHQNLLLRSIDAAASGGQFRYTLNTTAFHEGRQIPVTAYEMFGDNHRRLTKIDPSRFTKLTALAKEILATAGIDPSIEPFNAWDAAYAMQDHFRTSDLYTYTLDFRDVRRDASIDPIEDFVSNNRQGHCEYFASALAMMLRSQGIPSRIVVGFRGGDYNIMGDYYQVKDKHAHAWVEAYMFPNQIKDNFNLHPDVTSSRGVWLRLDPTPLSSIDEAEKYQVTLMERVDQVLDYFQLLWADYVTGFNSERQKESIYDPLAMESKESVLSMLDPRKLLQGSQPQASSTVGRVGWLLGAAIALLGGTLFATYVISRVRKGAPSSTLGRLIFRVVQFVSPRLAQWLQTPPNDRRRAIRVEFYEQFVTLLARHGITRGRHQTQREFAHAVASQFLATPSERDLVDLPDRVVDAYYRVRFGGQTLSLQENETIDQSLVRLQSTLSARLT